MRGRFGHMAPLPVRSRRLAAHTATVTTATGALTLALLGLLGASGAGATTLAGQRLAEAPSSVPQRAPVPALVGDWLGPFPGPAGACNPENAEWYVYASGSYSFTWKSEDCGGATSYGHYGVRGDLLTFYQQSVPNCGTCTQRQTVPLSYKFVNGYKALRLCDYPMGACYTYNRRH